MHAVGLRPQKPPVLDGSVDDQERQRANFGTYLAQRPVYRHLEPHPAAHDEARQDHN
jgi:hypothetical protein